MVIKEKVLVYLLFFIVLFTYYGYAGSENIGTSSANFLKLDPSAEFSALGGAGTGSSSGISSLFYNPGSVVSSGSKYNLLITHSQNFQNISLNSILLCKREKDFSLNAGLIYLDKGSIDAFDEDGKSLGKKSADDMLFLLGFSSSEMIINGGMTFKLIRMTIADEKGTAGVMDMGIMKKINNKINIGIAIKNISLTDLKFINNIEKVPREIRAGVKVETSKNVTTYFDLSKSRDNLIKFFTGLEFAFIQDRIFIRSGYNSIYDSGNKFTFGFGLNYNKFKMDYAYNTVGFLGDIHKITVGINF